LRFAEGELPAENLPNRQKRCRLGQDRGMSNAQSTARALRPNPSGPFRQDRITAATNITAARHHQGGATFTGQACRRAGVAKPEDSIALRPWRPRLTVAEAGEKRDAGRKTTGI
jgi:hypothetical protein